MKEWPRGAVVPVSDTTSATQLTLLERIVEAMRLGTVKAVSEDGTILGWAIQAGSARSGSIHTLTGTTPPLCSTII